MTRAQATALEARPRPGPVAADALVLAGRPLRPGIDPASTARFGQDVWPLTPAIHQLHHQALSLDFTTIPAPLRAVCKELFLAMLTLDLPTGLPPLHVVTIRSHFSAVKEFLTWADARGIGTLANLATIDVAGYGRHLDAQRVSAVTRERKQYAVRLFWVFRGKLHSDAPPSDPAVVLGMPFARPTRRTPSENTTDRIPEPVLAPLLVWALRWIEDFADDILTAAAEIRQLRACGQPGRTGHSGAQQRLATLLEDYRHERKPLPGQGHLVRHRGPSLADPVEKPTAASATTGGPVVNMSYLALRVGCSSSSLFYPATRRLITEAARELGVAADTYLSTVINGELNGRAWLPAFGLSTLPELARHLQTACYLVIAYLSGMRDSEVKHLRRGCLQAWKDQTGRPVRHKVTSLAFKGEHAADGVEATWIVGAPVARAVTVLQALQPPEQPLLFAVLPTSHNRDRAKANTVKISYSTNRDLAGFAAWINTYCAAHDRVDVVPDVDGRAWKLTTRQFRRILSA